jgi:hypothetical protein
MRKRRLAVTCIPKKTGSMGVDSELRELMKV